MLRWLLWMGASTHTPSRRLNLRFREVGGGAVSAELTAEKELLFKKKKTLSVEKSQANCRYLRYFTNMLYWITWFDVHW